MTTPECVELDGETVSSNYHSLKRATSHFTENHLRAAIRTLAIETSQI
jgi:hypothetical protein